MRKAMFAVTGMTCAACSARVEKAVRQVAGVSEVSVNLLKNSMKVAFDEAAVSPAQIADAVRQAGYGAQPCDGAAGQGGGKADRGADTLADELRAMRRRLLVSFCFLVPLMYLSMGHMLGLPLPEALLPAAHPLTSAFVQFLLTLPIMIVNGKYYRVGFKTLFSGAPNMDSLIALGSGAAALSVLLVLLVVFTPLSGAFGLIALPAKGYGIALLLILVPLLVMELSKKLALISHRK